MPSRASVTACVTSEVCLFTSLHTSAPHHLPPWPARLASVNLREMAACVAKIRVRAFARELQVELSAMHVQGQHCVRSARGGESVSALLRTFASLESDSQPPMLMPRYLLY